jgi:hypothetical protein
MMNSNSRTAVGTINPARFVMSGAAQASLVAGSNGILLAAQCSGPGVPIIGIGHESTTAMMGTQAQIDFVLQGYPAATVGKPLRVYEDGESTLLVVGSGQIVEPDDYLISDASGNAVPLRYASVAAGIHWVGARAIEYGFAGDPIFVQVYTRAVTKPA